MDVKKLAALHDIESIVRNEGKEWFTAQCDPRKILNMWGNIGVNEGTAGDPLHNIDVSETGDGRIWDVRKNKYAYVHILDGAIYARDGNHRCLNAIHHNEPWINVVGNVLDSGSMWASYIRNKIRG